MASPGAATLLAPIRARAASVGTVPAYSVLTPKGPKPSGLFSRFKASKVASAPPSPGDSPGGTYDARCRPEVKDVLISVLDFGLHIVYAGCGEGDPPVALTLQTAETKVEMLDDVLRIPDEAEAVLVLTDPRVPHSGARMIQEFKSLPALNVPVVAVLLVGDRERDKDLAALIGATTVLAMARADDIIVQPACQHDLPTMLAVIAEKLECQAKAKRSEKLAAGTALRTMPLGAWPAEAAYDAGEPMPQRSRSGPCQSMPAQGAVLTPSPEQERKEKSTQGSHSYPRRLQSPVRRFGGAGREAKREQRRKGEAQAMMWAECRFLKQLRHPHVACVQDVLDAHVLLPLHSEGAPNLQGAILQAAGGRLELQRAQMLFWQITSGVAYCHKKGVAHRNLKPENITVVGDHAKVANFSLAVKLGHISRDTCGTMPFVAPEVLAGSGYDAASADAWSMAVVLLEMLCGLNKLLRMLNWPSTPNPSAGRARDLEVYFRSSSALLQNVQADIGDVPDLLEELLAGLLVVSPKERWTAAKARDSHWASTGAARLPELISFSSELSEELGDRSEAA